MIGSSNCGPAFGTVCRYAALVAISNASAEESTAWNAPSIKRELDVKQRIAGHRAFTHAGRKCFLNCAPVFARYVTAGNFRLELITCVLFSRFDGVIDLAVLTGTTGLLLVGVRVFDHLRDRFAVGDLRLTHFDVNAVGTPKDIDLDVEVQFAHTLDQGLARVFVGRNLE